MPDLGYGTVIERGQSLINDLKHDYLAKKISGPWLDVGCNTGWLLEDVPNGTGLDASWEMVLRGTDKGLRVIYGRAEAIPLRPDSFRTVVLSSVLEAVENWKLALSEALRVGLKVIGVNPIPGSPWGKVGPHRWVKSVIDPESLRWMGAYVEPISEHEYFFSI